MPLSGVDVIFPLAFSGTEHGVDLLYHDTFSEQEFNTFFPLYYGTAEREFPVIGEVGNFRYFTFFAFDAGALGLGTNVIPSGSTIDDVKIEVEVKDPTPTNFTPTDDPVVHASLVDRDGIWNSPVSGYGWAKCNVDVGAETVGENRAPMFRLRNSANTSVAVLPENLAASDHIWFPIRRTPIDDERTAMDSFGAVFTSTVTVEVGFMAMRLRRTGGNLLGSYRYELWSVSGDDVPDQLLAYSAQGTVGNISTATAGAIHQLGMAGGGGFYTLTSGTKYFICYNSSRTTAPSTLNAGSNMEHIAVMAKDIDTTWTSPIGCVALSGVGQIEGHKHLLSRANYGVRSALPTLQGYAVATTDVASYGGYVASGLTGPTFGAPDGTWVELSGANSHYMVSAMQAWIDDPLYTTSGYGARLMLQLTGPPVYDGSPAALLSGARMLISWSAPIGPTPTPAPDLDWFDARGTQDWHSARGTQDWHTARGSQDWHSSRGTQDWHSSRGSRDWFDSWED